MCPFFYAALYWRILDTQIIQEKEITLNSKTGELGEGYFNYRWYDSFVGKYDARYIKTRTNKGVWKVCRSQDGNKILTIFPSIPFELERFFF